MVSNVYDRNDQCTKIIIETPLYGNRIGSKIPTEDEKDDSF